MLEGNHVQFSVPVLIAISATYAAVIYILMAVYQRFIPFAYFGLVALLVADLAVSDALNLYYWWWPSMAMILAIPATISLKRGGENGMAIYTSLGSAARSYTLRNVFHCGRKFAVLSFIMVYSLGLT